MLDSQLILPIHNEITVDLFAGGGGASTGIEMALGRYVDIAINHDPQALSLHAANHPQTKHYCEDVFDVDPVAVVDGRPVGLLWASPDCKHFSKAKGSKPVSKKIRSLAWVVVKWAKLVQPRVICLENVEEFQTWGPLGSDDMPIKVRAGETFQHWIRELEKLGYNVEYRTLRACDYGVPTIRKRLFLVARRDGQPIVWPAQTHGTGRGLKPYRTAAENIDFNLPCPSIFGRKKPLSENTLRRIAKGIKKFVIDNPKPFIISIANYSSESVRDGAAPLSTITANPKGGHHAMVLPFIKKYYGGVVGSPIDSPVGTITTIDHNAYVSSHLVKLRGTNTGHAADEPLHTISAQGTHLGEVRALLIKYYGNEKDGVDVTEPLHTIPTKDRFGLVTVYIAGEPYVITDIGMRMLAPKELFACQGFPKHYHFERGADGETLTKAAQVRMCGNSVCPPIADAIVRANYGGIK